MEAAATGLIEDEDTLAALSQKRTTSRLPHPSHECQAEHDFSNAGAIQTRHSTSSMISSKLSTSLRGTNAIVSAMQ